MNQWSRIELSELGRLVHGVRKDEGATRAQLVSLRNDRNGFVGFCSGRSTFDTRSAFRKTMASLEQTDLIKSFLQEPVPALPSDEFITTSESDRFIQPDNSLPVPPAVLANSGESAVAQTRSDFDTAWYDIVDTLLAGKELRVEQIERFRTHTQRWHESVRPNMRHVTPTARFQVEDYFRSVFRLCDALESSGPRLIVSNKIRGEGVAFEGGTFAALMDHVVRKRLGLKSGSVPQLLMAELGHEIVRELDTQISTCEYRLEHYKAQNVSHNAALKIRVARWPVMGGGHAGLGSGAYGRRLPDRLDVGGRPLPESSLERFRQIIARATKEPEMPPHVAAKP